MNTRHSEWGVYAHSDSARGSAAKAKMNNKISLFLVCSRLDDNEIGILSRTSRRAHILIAEIARSDSFWYVRTQCLMGSYLAPRLGNWQSTYYTLRWSRKSSSLMVTDRMAIEILFELDRYHPSSDDNWTLREACMDDNIEVISLLLSNPKTNPTVLDNIAVISSAAMGCAGAVRLLLADGRPDPTARDNEALKKACERDHPDVVLVLLSDERISVSVERALLWACTAGSSKVVRELLTHLRDLPTLDHSCLVQARKHRHYEVIRLLVEDGRATPEAEKPVEIEKSTTWPIAAICLSLCGLALSVSIWKRV